MSTDRESMREYEREARAVSVKYPLKHCQNFSNDVHQKYFSFLHVIVDPRNVFPEKLLQNMQSTQTGSSSSWVYFMIFEMRFEERCISRIICRQVIDISSQDLNWNIRHRINFLSAIINKLVLKNVKIRKTLNFSEINSIWEKTRNLVKSW